MILSPILQNEFLKCFDAKNSELFKQYAPNLKTILSKDEFSIKIEFDFDYLDKTIGKIGFYSLKDEIVKQEEKEA